MWEVGSYTAQRPVSTGKSPITLLVDSKLILITSYQQIFHDALCTLNENVSGAVVSPSLIGSHGVLPLTIISVYVN